MARYLAKVQEILEAIFLWISALASNASKIGQVKEITKI
jgi:hypothetical protein